MATKVSELQVQREEETKRVMFASYPDEPVVKIKIIFNKDDGVGPQVMCSHNGNRFWLQRGKIIEVPQCVYLALNQPKKYDIIVY